jgi:hypothetical protein
MGVDGSEAEAGAHSMNGPLRIEAAEAVIPGVLKVVWSDGYEGVVDLRGLLSSGAVFEALREPRRFHEVKVAAFGHSVYWGEEGDEEVDFGSDRLREIAEDQAALLAKAS